MDSDKHGSSHEVKTTPDTSHLIVSARQSDASRKRRALMLTVVLLIVIALAIGGFYVAMIQIDKDAGDAETKSKNDQSSVWTPEEQMTATLTTNVQRQLNAATKDDVSVGIESSTAAAQQVASDLGETDPSTCVALNSFTQAATNTLKTAQATMEATFTAARESLQSAEKLQDTTAATERQVAEDMFTAQVEKFAAANGLNATQKTAISSYQDLMITSIHTNETNADAAIAEYHQDALTLAIAHQASLRGFVQKFAATITDASTGATAKCSATTLMEAIQSAKAQLMTDIAISDTTSTQKAANLAAIRNTVLLQQSDQFTRTATDATATLTKVILTGKDA